MTPGADVASNGQITCHGSLSPARQQDYFKGGGTSCNNGYLLPGSYNPPEPDSDLSGAGRTSRRRRVCPATYNPCPAVAGVLPGALVSGVYYCSQADLTSKTMAFPPVFSVLNGGANNGVVEIFVIPTDSSNITVSIADAAVNQNGDPTKLRVYLSGGTIDPGQRCALRRLHRRHVRADGAGDEPVVQRQLARRASS